MRGSTDQNRSLRSVDPWCHFCIKEIQFEITLHFIFSLELPVVLKWIRLASPL